MFQYNENLTFANILETIIVMHQKGNIALIPLIIILLLIVAGVAYFIGSKGNIKNLLQKQPEPQLKTEYKNPFEKESQYLNPFNEYKNPFDVIRANE